MSSALISEEQSSNRNSMDSFTGVSENNNSLSPDNQKRAARDLPFKAQVQGGRPPSAAPVLAQAVPVEETLDTGDVEKQESQSKKDKEHDENAMVCVVTRTNILWGIGILLVVVVLASVGGFCASGNCGGAKGAPPGTRESSNLASPNQSPNLSSSGAPPPTPVSQAITSPTSSNGAPPPTPVSQAAPTSAACSLSSDCPNGACAKASIASSSPKVCCSTGQSNYLYSPISETICTGQEVGAMCGSSNSICASGVCYQGRCLEGRQPNGQSCDDNEDCEGTCVAGSCGDGFKPTEATCDDDDDCANGECGYKTLGGGEIHCCPTGSSVYFYSPISRTVCDGQAAGASCSESNSVCASGVCFEGLCLDGKQPSGQPCGNNAHCAGTCVDGTCVDGFLATEEACDDDDDCANGECGYKELGGSEIYCCPTGRSVYFYSPISRNVCDGQPAGAACGTSSSICASGVCLQGTCLEGKQPNGQPCANNGDCEGTCVGGTCVDGFLAVEEVCDDGDDCANGECGFKALGSSEIHCCPTGESVYFYSPISREVCGGQPPGASCRESDSLCSSGVCVQGTCRDAKQPNGQPCDENSDCVGTCVGGSCVDGFLAAEETCDDDNDCANGECAYKTAADNEIQCCPSGRSTYLSSPISRTVCTGQAAGMPCGTASSVCSSGTCVGGLCE